MKTDCHISDNTRWVVGNYSEEFNPLIELYNTWVCFFTKESMDHCSFRYMGTRGGAIETDTIRLGVAIIEYLNNEYEPNIEMLTFMEDVKYSRCFDKGYYEKARGWFLNKEVDHPVHIEHAFFKMIDLFRVQSLKKAMDAEGINISI